ncbi:MAG: hypothetical protein ACLFNK_04795 [Candidatus Woesearchaeota archaeon]
MLKKELFVDTSQPETLRDALLIEERLLDASRFKWTSTTRSDGVVFKLEADDPTAMKAAESSVDRLVLVYKKISALFSV